MWQFHFDRQKKIQAVGVVLTQFGGPIDWMRLLKVLYIADRRALKETGKPIVGGRAVAMKNGPLHSEIYDLLKGQHEDRAEWEHHFATAGPHTIAMTRQPDTLDLSPYEIDVLQAVAEETRHVGTFELSDLTHEFGEWRQSYVEGTSTTIPLDVMLRELGFTVEEVNEIKKEGQTHSALAAAIGGG